MSVLSSYVLSLLPSVYWEFGFSSFDQDSGSLNVDIFGTGAGAGTFTNAFYAQGKFAGDDAVYRGSPMFIIGNTDASLANNGSFSLVFSNVYVETQTVLTLNHGLGSADQILLNATAGSGTVATIAQGVSGLYTSVVDPEPLTVGWHDIVMTWNGSKLHLWVDGVLVAVSAFVAGTRGTETDGFLDIALAGTDKTEGVVYFTRVLSDSEILGLHRAANSIDSHYVGGLRARLIHESIYKAILEALTALGWFDPGRNHSPIQFLSTGVETHENVTVNTAALADWDITEVDQELGSHLSGVRHTYFVDFYAENDAVGIHFSQDVKDLIGGRMASVGRTDPSFVIYDYQQATPPEIFTVFVENIVVDRPSTFSRPWQRYFRTVGFTVLDYYADESL